MPLPLLHAAGWLLGWLSFALSGRYRRRLFAHAAQAGVSRRVALASVGESGKLVAELPRLWLGSPVRVDWQGAGHIEAQQTQGSGVLFTSYNARDITRIVRAERFNLALIVLATALVSVQLGLRLLLSCSMRC